MPFSARWFILPILSVLLLPLPALSQTSSDLSVHATPDSLTVTIGSETITVPRDALELLSSPEGYSQDALSLHVALLHGVLTEEEPPPGEDPPENDPPSTSPVLSASTPLALHAGGAERSAGSEGHEWEDALLDARTVVQMLPDIGSRYGGDDGPELSWPVEVEDTDEYYLYVYAAGIRGGNDLWAGTEESVDNVLVTKQQKLEWRRVGPFALEAGTSSIKVRGLRDGAYFAALVVSTRSDFNDDELETVLDSATRSGVASGTSADASAKGTAGGGTPIPESFALHPAYPNPTRGESTLQLDLPEDAEVDISVFDTVGRQVEQRRVTLEAGFRHPLAISTAALSSGVYIVRVLARTPEGDTVGSRRLTVLR